MIGVALLLATALASHEPQAPEAVGAPARQTGESLTVYLLTMGPGDQVWERFGHNAIRIHDSATGSDIAYHWGLFNFADKDFIPRFVQGRMRYSMGAFGMAETVEAYRQANRTVWMQELALEPAQRLELADFLAWNMLPENREYSYDYYRDNCSTRVRDALDSALGGVIQTATGEANSGTTFRFHTLRLTQDDWPIFTGTMIGLGQPTDGEITAWEEMFLPVRMMDRLRRIGIDTPEGARPLVKGEQVLFQATRAPEATSVTRGMAGYLGIAALVLVVGAMAVFNSRSSGAIALAVVWSGVAGVAGSLLAFLWVFTDHLYSYRNENLLQLNPLSLVLVVLLVRFLWKRRGGAGEAGRRAAMHAALFIAFLSLVGFIVQALPGMNQVNGDVIALALPVHLGVVALLAAIRRPRETI